MDIVPSKRLGPFVLGMPVGQALEYLQEHEREISSVQIVIGGNLDGDFILELREETLRYVHVVDLGRVSLTYEGKPVAGPRAEPSLLALLSAFGPSYPGQLRAGRYELNYPGVGFVFRASGLVGVPDGPLEAPLQEGSLAATAHEMLVFRGKQLGSPQDVSLGKVTQALPGCEHYLEEIILRVGRGVELPSRQAFLGLGCSAQDVRLVLGEPDRVFAKTDARLKIHAEDDDLQESGGAASDGSGDQDYFFNFFGLGLDVLLDGQSHRALKFVAHSNAPQHDSFFQHSRARWSVAVGELPPVLSVGQRMGSEARAALLLPEKQDPVVHSRPDGTRHISTSFFGREGLILETLKSGQIETVQIF